MYRNHSIDDDCGAELSIQAQHYAFGMVLEVEVDFLYYASTFGNCDHYDLLSVRVIGHYPEGDMSEDYNKGKYVPVSIPVKVEDLSEDDVKELSRSCAAHVRKLREDY